MNISEEPITSIFHSENKAARSHATLVTFRHTLWCHSLEKCILDRYSDICKSHLPPVPVAEFT